MAQTTVVVHHLTQEFIEAGKELVSVLDQDGVPISGAYWLMNLESETWRLVLVSRDVEEHGKRAFYHNVGESIRGANIEELNVINLKAVSPDDPVFVRLRKVAKIPDGQVRMTGNVLDGLLIPDALVYRLT